MIKNEEFEKFKELFDKAGIKVCQVCGGVLEFEKVNLEDYQGGKLYIMEKVPAFVCQECGEIWVPEPFMVEFEKMIEVAKHRTTRIKESQGKKEEMMGNDK